MSTRSEVAKQADSIVTTVEEDGYRIAEPTEAEMEVLKILLERNIHEVISINIKENQ